MTTEKSTPSGDAVFEAIHAFTSRWEGGYTNHPADPGGATNYGISLRFLEGMDDGDINQDGAIDPEDIRALTLDRARAFFKREFWGKPKLYLLPPLTASAVYDFGVNAGLGQSVKLLQKVLNVPVDGILGPVTRQAAAKQAEAPQGQRELAEALLTERDIFYLRLADRKPSSRVFLRGWRRRTDDLRQYLQTLANRWGC